MADDRKRIAKSESLTIRLNPRVRFLLEFVSRVKGQTITTVVERAITDAADATQVAIDGGFYKNWRDFWDTDEGVRSLKMAMEPDLFPTYEEEKRLEFAKYFREYFFTATSRLDTPRNRPEPNRAFVSILWPHIDFLIDEHNKNKATDFFYAEKLMRTYIINAQVEPPVSARGVRLKTEPEEVPF